MAALTEPLRATAVGTTFTTDGSPAALSRARSKGTQGGRISSPPSSPNTPLYAIRAPLAPNSARVATNGALHLTLGVSLGDALALVPRLLAFDQRHLDLGAPVPEVEAERDQGQSLFADLAVELDDLAPVHQQAAAARGLVVLPIARLPRLDVHVLEEGLAVLNADEAVLDVDLAGSERLDLGAEELEAGLDLVEDEVLVKRGPVVGNRLLALSHDEPPGRAGRARIRPRASLSFPAPGEPPAAAGRPRP